MNIQVPRFNFNSICSKGSHTIFVFGENKNNKTQFISEWLTYFNNIDCIFIHTPYKAYDEYSKFNAILKPNTTCETIDETIQTQKIRYYK
jgi:hypothetical protein